jgi:NADH:ubiquinone oxidoreductase subunit 2 (subunit N)
MINFNKNNFFNIFPYSNDYIELQYFSKFSSFNDLYFVFLPEILLFFFIILYFLTFLFKKTLILKNNFIIYNLFLLLIFFSFFFSYKYYNYEFTLISYYYIWLTKFILIIFLIFFTFLHYYQMYFAWYNNNLIDVDLGSKYFELNLILLISLLCSFIFISSNDLLVLLVSLEVFSLCSYIIAALIYEKISIEAGIKYFISSIFFSFFLILGICFIYWGFFNLNFSIINQIIVCFLNLNEYINLLEPLNIDLFNLISMELNLIFFKKIKWLIIGLFFIFLSFICKLGLFPGHFWVLDVYGNISVLSNTFLSIFPKFIYLIILIKLQIQFQFLTLLTPLLNYCFLLFGFLSIIYGSFVTINQWRIKKFMAASSIVNLGFLLLLLGSLIRISFHEIEFNTVFSIMFKIFFFFLIVYLITIFFFFLTYMITIQPNNIKLNYFFEDLREFVQLRHSYKLIIIVTSLIFLSFTGLPPLMGFYPKLYLINYFIINNLFITLFFILIFSAINAFYYIRVIRFLIFSNINIFGLFQISKITTFIYYLILIFIFSFFFFNFFFIIHCII